VNELIEQVDIPSTILDLAHIDVPIQMEGRSLKPLLRGNNFDERPAYSMVFLNNPSTAKITTGTIAVWEGDYKLIYYIGEEKYLLYNLKTDYEENNNLFDSKPEVASHMLNLIHEKLRKANEGR